MHALVQAATTALAVHGRWRRHLANVDLFLAPSRSTIEQHQRRGASPTRCEHLPYFLRLRGESGADAGSATGPGLPARTSCSSGRLVKLKGVQALIEAFRRYDSRGSLIAGDGVLGGRAAAQAAGSSTLGSSVACIREDLRALYADAIAALVPSLAYETFGFIGSRPSRSERR